jgi:hypothetical protein
MYDSLPKCRKVKCLKPMNFMGNLEDDGKQPLVAGNPVVVLYSFEVSY